MTKNAMKQDSIALSRLLKRFDMGSCKTVLDCELAFYRLIIDYERSKEPDIQKYYTYPINYKAGSDGLILVDMPCNADFLKEFALNQDKTKTRFPRDFYIALEVTICKKKYKLLYISVEYDDFSGFNPYEELFPVQISNFQLNYSEVDRLELEDPKRVDTIAELLGNCLSISDVLNCLKSEFGDSVMITDSLFLGLGSKNIALSQLASELANSKMQNILGKTLVSDFLSYNKFVNKLHDVDPDGLINVMPLEESQRNAIAAALGSRVTVITGAPGTGKTQVIENLIANALLQGKKVLVTSKNNKAVDNVKDRFKTIVDSEYLVRFGSKSEINRSTVPVLSNFLSSIPAIEFKQSDFQDLNVAYKDNLSCISNAKALIGKKRKLKKDIDQVSNSIKLLKGHFDKLKDNHNASIIAIEEEYSNIGGLKSISRNELSDSKSQFVVLRNEIDEKFTGFFGFWHNWFSRGKYAMKLLNMVETFPMALRVTINDNAEHSMVSDFKSYDDFHSFCDKAMQPFVVLGKYQSAIDGENTKFCAQKDEETKRMSALEAKFSKLQKEFDSINEDSQRGIINCCKKWIADNSLLLLQGIIKCNLKSSGAAGKISVYKSYFPDNIPWKDSDYSSFVKHSKAFLDVFGVCSVTSLSTKSAFPLASELFDLLIIDEASQCDVASALPLIMRAKQLVVIGDPMQLRHITSVKVSEENAIKEHLGIANSLHLKYVESSLWDYTNEFVHNASLGFDHNFMLESHFRCHPDIIGYSNELFYKAKLGRSLVVKTDVSKLKWKQQGVFIVDVKGQQTSDDINVNKMEVDKAIQLVIKLANENKEVSIGIITPFRDQAEALNSAIPIDLRDRVDASTVNKYQGDERDVIVYSLVVTNNSPDRKIGWIDKVNPNLVNVAVTRAKSTLYVICNVDYIKKMSRECDPLGYLIKCGTKNK